MPFIIQQCILPLTMTASSLSVGCCFCIILRPQNIGQPISQLRFADVPLDQTSEMNPPPLLSGLMAFLSGILPGIRGGFPYCLGFSDLSNVMLRGIATPYPLLEYFILPLKLEYKSIPTKILFTCPWTRKHTLLKYSMKEGMVYHLCRMAEKGESNKTVKCSYWDYLNIHILSNLDLTVHVIFNRVIQIDLKK